MHEFGTVLRNQQRLGRSKDKEKLGNLDLHMVCKHSLRDVVANVVEVVLRGCTGNLSEERARIY